MSRLLLVSGSLPSLLQHALLDDRQFHSLKEIYENDPDVALKKSQTKETARDNSGSQMSFMFRRSSASGYTQRACQQLDTVSIVSVLLQRLSTHVCDSPFDQIFLPNLEDFLAVLDQDLRNRQAAHPDLL